MAVYFNNSSRAGGNLCGCFVFADELLCRRVYFNRRQLSYAWIKQECDFKFVKQETNDNPIERGGDFVVRGFGLGEVGIEKCKTENEKGKMENLNSK